MQIAASMKETIALRVSKDRNEAVNTNDHASPELLTFFHDHYRNT